MHFPDKCYDFCCPTGASCNIGGCCPAGEIQCGALRCYNPSTQICCSAESYACKLGATCVGNGRCCASGRQSCGVTGCYDPATERCCNGISNVDGKNCDSDETCCSTGCCTAAGVCGSGGYCIARSCTATRITRFTVYQTYTRTITKLAEAEREEESELPDFICLPMTVTDEASASLELGDDCSLTYYPPPPATAAALSPGSDAMVARAAECLSTTTVLSSTTIRSVVTATTTVTETTTPESFSCLAMSATNAAGDELSLDEDCVLELKPGDADPTATGSQSAASGGSSASLSASARRTAV